MISDLSLFMNAIRKDKIKHEKNECFVLPDEKLNKLLIVPSEHSFWAFMYFLFLMGP